MFSKMRKMAIIRFRKEKNFVKIKTIQLFYPNITGTTINIEAIEKRCLRSLMLKNLRANQELF